MRITISIIIIVIAVLGCVLYADWKRYQSEGPILLLNPTTMTYQWSTRGQLKTRNQKAGYELPTIQYVDGYAVQIVIDMEEESE